MKPFLFPLTSSKEPMAIDTLAIHNPEPSIKPLNIYDIYRGMREKKVKRIKTYDTVLAKCYSKIKQAAESESFRALYEIPDFIVGVPLYDINHCMEYVISQLKNNGFVVKYFFPKLLYISWDYKELKEDKNKTKTGKYMQSEGSPSSVSKTTPPQPPPPQPPKVFDSMPLHSPSENTIQNLHKFRDAPKEMPKYNPSVHGTYENQSIVGRTPFPKHIAKFKPSGKFVLDLN